MDAYCLKPDELPDLEIETLGEPTIDNALKRSSVHFVEDDEKVMVYADSESLKVCA